MGAGGGAKERTEKEGKEYEKKNREKIIQEEMRKKNGGKEEDKEGKVNKIKEKERREERGMWKGDETHTAVGK